MGQDVADLKHREIAIRCPVETPPGSVTVELTRRLGSVSTPATLTVAQDTSLIAAADVSQASFHSSAASILGSWYSTGLRSSVTVGGVTYNEKVELWELYKVLS